MATSWPALTAAACESNDGATQTVSSGLFNRDMVVASIPMAPVQFTEQTVTSATFADISGTEWYMEIPKFASSIGTFSIRVDAWLTTGGGNTGQIRIENITDADQGSATGGITNNSAGTFYVVTYDCSSISDTFKQFRLEGLADGGDTVHVQMVGNLSARFHD